MKHDDYKRREDKRPERFATIGDLFRHRYEPPQPEPPPEPSDEPKETP